MSNSPFRFVHASDLHLERPPCGLAEIPDHLRQVLVDAPYRAAERVFDAAIKEQVDFVVLAGDIMHAALAGPRGIVFLSEQFGRLASRGIAVYCADGTVDDHVAWSEAIELPGIVHFFPPDRVSRFVHERDGQPLVQLLGTSSSQHRTIPASEFCKSSADLFSVAVAFGSAEPESLPKQGIEYWALGGEHGRRTLSLERGVAHYPGSPQGRQPDEPGPHGCTLVQVDETGRVRTSFIVTDSVRWQHEKNSIGEATQRHEVEKQLDDRASVLLSDPFGPDLLVRWTIAGTGPLANQLRRGNLGLELLSRMRADYAQRRPALWTVSLQGEAPSAVPENLYEQETIVGEFLRATRRYEDDPAEPLDMGRYLAPQHMGGSIAPAIEIADARTRTRVLREVARLGVELLTPEEPLP